MTLDASELRALHVLLSVHREGGFAPAARELHVTRAAVSRSIAQLEAKLGVRLARRTTRQVVLTDAALALVDRAQAPLEMLSEAMEKARDQGRALAGPVQLAGPVAFGRDVIAPRVAAFCAAHPDVRVSLRLDDAIDDLVARPIDVAVRLGPLPTTSLVARRVGVLPVVLAATPALLAAHGSPRSVAELEELPAIAFRVAATARRLPWPFVTGKRQRLFEPTRVVVECDAIDGVAALVRASAGVGLVPRHLAQDDLDAGRLVSLLPKQLGAGPTVSVCYAAREHVPARVRALVDTLVRTLPDALRRVG